MKFLPLIWSGIARKKIRTILTVLSILVAFLLYGYLSAFTTALGQGIDVVGLDRIVVRHKVSLIQMLPESYLNRIARIDGVDAVVHATWFGGVYKDPKNFFGQFPVDPESYLDMFPELLLPADQKEKWLRTRTGAIVGRQIADRFDWKIGDRIPIQADHWLDGTNTKNWEFDLVGIYEPREKGVDDTQFLFHQKYFEETRTEQAKGLVGWYTVRIQDPEQSADVAAAINSEFENSPAEVNAESEMAFIQGFAKQVGNIGSMMVAILSAVFFTILLVAGNTMAQSVRERTAEIGVLKALGFPHTGVLGLILLESTTIAVAGGFIGLAVAWVLIARGDPTGGALPLFYFPTRDLIVGATLALALGLTTGLPPAIQAMRLQIAQALRRD